MQRHATAQFQSPAKERPAKSPAKERPKKARPDTPGKSPRKQRPSGLVAARWTPEEEARLRALVLQYSGERGKWKAIAEELGTGRTGAAVQQHYAKHMQGDIDDMAEPDSPTPAAPAPVATSTVVVSAAPTAKRSMLPMAGAAPPPSAMSALARCRAASSSLTYVSALASSFSWSAGLALAVVAAVGAYLFSVVDKLS